MPGVGECRQPRTTVLRTRTQITATAFGRGREKSEKRHGWQRTSAAFPGHAPARHLRRGRGRLPLPARMGLEGGCHEHQDCQGFADAAPSHCQAFLALVTWLVVVPARAAGAFCDDASRHGERLRGVRGTVWITDRTSHRVLVYDAARLCVQATIDLQGSRNPIGIIGAGCDRIYVSNEDTNSVSVISRRTLAVVKTIAVGPIRITCMRARWAVSCTSRNTAGTKSPPFRRLTTN